MLSSYDSFPLVVSNDAQFLLRFIHIVLGLLGARLFTFALTGVNTRLFMAVLLSSSVFKPCTELSESSSSSPEKHLEAFLSYTTFCHI